MRLIDEVHIKYPFYGSRRIRDWLEDQGLKSQPQTDTALNAPICLRLPNITDYLTIEGNLLLRLLEG